MARRRYNASQPRDSHGRWSKAGRAGRKVQKLRKRYASTIYEAGRVGNTVILAPASESVKKKALSSTNLSKAAASGDRGARKIIKAQARYKSITTGRRF